MDDGDEFSGRTVDDALRQAEQALGQGRQDLDVEILTHGRGGVFGIGAEPARIRASVRAAAEAASQPPESVVREVADVAAAQDGPLAHDTADDAADDDVQEERAERAPRSEADLAQEATRVLEKLLSTMGIHAQVHVQNRADPLTLGVTGENLGVLIGRRGDNLAAMQFMVNLILSKNRRQWPRIVLDVENYRARREESLRALAERVAYRVQRNHRAFTLEAMPASDRRVVHLALRDRTDVETYSIGEGPSRRVVVAPTRQGQSPMDRDNS